MKFKKEKEPDKEATRFAFLEPDFEKTITERLKRATDELMQRGDALGEKQSKAVEELDKAKKTVEQLKTDYQDFLSKKDHLKAASANSQRKAMSEIIKDLEKRVAVFDRESGILSRELDSVVEATLKELHQQETVFLRVVSDKLKQRIDGYKPAVEAALSDLGLSTDMFSFYKFTEMRIRDFADFTMT